MEYSHNCDIFKFKISLTMISHNFKKLHHFRVSESAKVHEERTVAYLLESVEPSLLLDAFPEFVLSWLTIPYAPDQAVILLSYPVS